MTEAIHLEDVWVSYDGQTVLEGISLNVYDHDFIGIIGPNGGGKSTLLKAVLGLITPDRGTIRIFGEPPQVGRREIGYVPQFSNYDNEFPISVWEVVLMGRLSKRGSMRWYNREDKKEAREALAAVDMLDYRKRHIDSLSGGQRQRVFIARALAAKARILLLDEPTASVDQYMQKNLYDLLLSLHDSMTIVLVTHDIGVISSYVDRIACLNHRLVSHDDDSVLTKEQLEKTYMCPVELIAHGVPHRVCGEHQ